MKAPDFTGIETQRLRLRPFVRADITANYLMWLSDPDATRFSNQRYRTHTAESAADYLASFEGSANLFCSIRDRETDIAIGTANAFRDVNHGTCDAGIMIGNRDYWGGGFGQEAWNAWVEWLLSDGGVRKVTAGCFETNVAARKMVERAGMKVEGVRAKHQIFDGEAGDVVLYARFADD